VNRGPVVVVVGNPRPQSRTFQAAVAVARALTGAEPDRAIDLAALGPALLDWDDPEVGELVALAAQARLLVVASPTYKGSYTGILKLFLDRFVAGSLAGVTTVPLMLGGGELHALAVEVFLKPVLAELGASCPSPGLFLVDTHYADLEPIRPQLVRLQRLLATDA